MGFVAVCPDNILSKKRKHQKFDLVQSCENASTILEYGFDGALTNVFVIFMSLTDTVYGVDSPDPVLCESPACSSFDPGKI